MPRANSVGKQYWDLHVFVCVGVNVFILRVGIYRVSKLLFDGPINQRGSLQKEILNLQGNSN
jgi:hypothetical protein